MCAPYTVCPHDNGAPPRASLSYPRTGTKCPLAAPSAHPQAPRTPPSRARAAAAPLQGAPGQGKGCCCCCCCCFLPWLCWWLSAALTHSWASFMNSPAMSVLVGGKMRSDVWWYAASCGPRWASTAQVNALLDHCCAACITTWRRAPMHACSVHATFSTNLSE